MHAPLRGIFGPNSLNAAHCAAFIWPKSPTKWHAQLPESNFQTRSRKRATPINRRNHPIPVNPIRAERFRRRMNCC
ncbi:DUF6783 domain-containing protein [Otoolea muris]|uniref:DUF6783 domain-containing protein n=1 Tax=Otoolea muris TaxID=2941515 RepID=UPI002FE6F54D